MRIVLWHSAQVPSVNIALVFSYLLSCTPGFDEHCRLLYQWPNTVITTVIHIRGKTSVMLILSREIELLYRWCRISWVCYLLLMSCIGNGLVSVLLVVQTYQ